MQSSINNWGATYFDTPRERDRRLKMLRRELSAEQLQRYADLEEKRNSRNAALPLLLALGIFGPAVAGAGVGGAFSGGDGAAIGGVGGLTLGALGTTIAAAMVKRRQDRATARAALRKVKRGDLGKYLDSHKKWSAWNFQDTAELDELTRALTPMYYDDPSTSK